MAEPRDIRIMDMAVHPTRYIPVMVKGLYGLGRGLLISATLTSVAGLGAILYLGATGSAWAFDALASKAGRKLTIKDGEKGIAGYRYSPLFDERFLRVPFNIVLDRTLRSREAFQTGNISSAYVFVVIKGSLEEGRGEKRIMSVGDWDFVPAGKAHRFKLSEGCDSCWRLLIPLGRSRLISAPAPKTEPPQQVLQSEDEKEEKNDEDERDPLAMDLDN